ncbi:MAG TPA: glycosyltransferase family 39 protein [Candidatus Acidoferrum sp.]|nr:glycosyltransferase family 39 protein [Candidatus Acidoferrum sp.]
MTKRVAWIAAGIVFVIHALANAHYGFFRDELYFIICGQHPQWGYVDQPPVVPLLAALTQIGGHSLFLLRLVPALCSAAGAFVTVLLVAEFGGGVFAQIFAVLVYALTGVLTNFGMKVSPDEIGLWSWPLIAYFVLRITKGADPRLWIAAGVVAGISLQSKYAVIFFLVALLVGLLLTPHRTILFSRWFALGSGLAVLIALPNFLWQAHYGFPMWELLRNGQNGKNEIVGPLVYIVQEFEITNIFLFPVWAIGFIWLLLRPAFRFLGYTYAILILEMMVLHGKHYYPADIYPITIAAGATAIALWTSRVTLWRIPIVAYALLLGTWFIPFDLPILPENTFVAYRTEIGKIFRLGVSTETEHGREENLLTGDYADMHGWPEMATAVQQIYNALPPDERARAVVFGDNYGEASAVKFFAPELPVISVHNQYWLWGPDGYDGSVLIQIGGTCWHKEGYFTSRTIAMTLANYYAINYETNIPINICRGLKIPVAELWAKSKSYE